MYIIRIKEGENKGKYLTTQGSKKYNYIFRYKAFYNLDKNPYVTDNIERARAFRYINHIKTSNIYNYKHKLDESSKECNFDELYEIVKVKLSIEE